MKKMLVFIPPLPRAKKGSVGSAEVAKGPYFGCPSVKINRFCFSYSFPSGHMKPLELLEAAENLRLRPRLDMSLLWGK